jgi:hypothetical protein
VSPTPNSSRTGWSPIEMPSSFKNVSHRRRHGIIGTNARQRTAVDWTPLSLHSKSRSSQVLSDLCSSPEPGHNWQAGRHAPMPVPLS